VVQFSKGEELFIDGQIRQTVLLLNSLRQINNDLPLIMLALLIKIELRDHNPTFAACDLCTSTLMQD
jgi:hypothetical protein